MPELEKGLGLGPLSLCTVFLSWGGEQECTHGFVKEKNVFRRNGRRGAEFLQLLNFFPI